MVANPGKFQLMYLGTNEYRSIFIDNMEIKDEVQLLGLNNRQETKLPQPYKSYL